MTELDDRTRILLHPSPDAVAEAIAARLIARIGEVQQDGRVPQICLTGGRIATKAYQHVAEDGPRSAVDWNRVELWWGDERWVAAESDDRNDAPTLALWDGVLGLDPVRIHRMPAAEDGMSLDDAADAYAAELGGVRFDVCLLGVGPDGHVASIFPEHPSSYATGQVIGVRSSPKPPPERLSLTLEVIDRSHEVWFTVSGEDKAAAVAMALLGTGDVQLPAAGAHGTDLSLWLLDRDAASKLPADLTQRGVI